MRLARAVAPVIVAMMATVAATVQPAQALTIRDVIELSRAGLADDVLVALIEVDGGVYPTDTETLKTLKDAGVSDRVMIAMIRSGRDRRVEPVPAPVVEDAPGDTPVPPTVVVEHRGVIEHREPQIQQVAVPVPVYVPVYPARGHLRRAEPFLGIQESTFVPLQPGVRPEPQAKPVYWGFGGKLRPDAWGQPQDRDKKAPDDRDKDTDKDKDQSDRSRPGRK